jgi:predicted hydrolase (HD superfamily)
MISYEKTLELLKEKNPNEIIITHPITINHVTNKIAEELIKKGTNTDKELIIVSSILHNVEQYSERERPVKNGMIMKNPVENKMEEIIEAHKIENFGRLQKIEEKIISFSNKRVKSDQIVPLNNKITDLLK